MQMILREHGSAEVARKFEISGIEAVNTRPAMEEILADMFRVEKLIFRSGGRRGGGSWRHLKPDTVRKKGNTMILRTQGAYAGYAPEEDALYNSVTEPGSKYQILNIGRAHVVLGTDRPFAGTHQRGSRAAGIPARPFLRFLPLDETRWKGIIRNHVLRAFQAARAARAGR